jgi:hypothetical protein
LAHSRGKVIDVGNTHAHTLGSQARHFCRDVCGREPEAQHRTIALHRDEWLREEG